MKPVIAIVGRPNVGKSTVFNYLAGARISIVEDTPGVTRDRIYADSNWCGSDFTIIDTGGIDSTSEDSINIEVKQQALLAIDMADVIVFVTDIMAGIAPQDVEVASILRRTKKPVILVCNKADNMQKAQNDVYEFYNLGLGEPMLVSALHGIGFGDVLDEAVKYFKKNDLDEGDEGKIKVAVIGKPNVGKSSMINKILGEKRLIVCDEAGTTRDAIDTEYEKDNQKYIFIDTAGLRKKSKVFDNIERYSNMRSFTAIERADVCLCVIDAESGLTEQDTKIFGYAHDQGKGLIIVVNKWDIIEKDTGTLEKYKKTIYEKVKFMDYAPVIFVSALTGQRIDKLFELIISVNEQNSMRVTTSVLNSVIGDATLTVQPPSDKGKRLKVYYATQISTKPPTFVIFVNNKDIMHFSYQRYLENQIRKNFGLVGTPVRFFIREKGEKD